MFNMLMNFVFTLVGKLGDIILSPLIAGISVLIPDFSSFVSSILQFINYGFTYITFFFKLLMIPGECLQVLVTVATASLAIITIVRSYTLIVKIYNYFKM